MKHNAHLVEVVIPMRLVQREPAAEYVLRAESAADSRSHTLMACRGFAAIVQAKRTTNALEKYILGKCARKLQEDDAEA